MVSTTLQQATQQQAASPAPANASTGADAHQDAITVKKLDLSRLSAPENLDEARLETFTIDGICGVY